MCDGDNGAVPTAEGHVYSSCENTGETAMRIHGALEEELLLSTTLTS